MTTRWWYFVSICKQSRSGKKNVPADVKVTRWPKAHRYCRSIMLARRLLNWLLSKVD